LEEAIRFADESDFPDPSTLHDHIYASVDEAYDPELEARRG
jgi:hypothetical protein